MSSLLNEAIIDAKALREAALKNAETAVIEKYSTEVKKTLEQLLEQEDLGAPPAEALPPEGEVAPEMPEMPDMAEEPMAEGEATEEISEDEIPLGATDNFNGLDGKNLNRFPTEGENVEVSIDLGALKEAVQELANDDNVEIGLSEETLAAIMTEDDEDAEDPQGSGEMGDQSGSAGEGESSAAQAAAQGEQDKESGYGGTDESLDHIVDSIVEKLTVDLGADLSGWPGISDDTKKAEMEKALAHRRSTDVAEEFETLKKAQEEVVFENNQLTEKNNEYKQLIGELREGLQDVNLSNARLLYTNRVLRNTSLNERQKTKIVEAISSAGSVAEARTIFDTLQSTVESTPKRGPQSLGEAITRRSSVMRASRQESAPSDPLAERMKRLAGIK